MENNNQINTTTTTNNNNNNNDNNNNTEDNNFKVIKEAAEAELEHKGCEDDEQFREDFKCCVCLELLYKPVVLGCGHISCFWCVYNAMNMWHESRCPLCCHPYNHFPGICQLLNFLLMKMYPDVYKKRERQVGDDEKNIGHFSPQVDCNLFGSNTSEEIDISANNVDSPSKEQIKLHSESHCSGEGKLSLCMKSLEIVEGEDGATLKGVTSSDSSQVTSNSTIQECSSIGNFLEHKACNQVSVDDLSCAACRRMLFKPVVLNCGHVYCESCIIVPEDGNFRCPNCQSYHPHGLPSVCLILEHFLEEQFPDLHAKRREAACEQTNGSTQARLRADQTNPCPKNVYASWWFGNGPNVHVGVGCDFCGMSPIIGERYKCKDCIETIGFDLCEACYKNPVKIPGRFNQQHKPDHKFEILQPTSKTDLLHWMNAELSDDDGSDATENRDGVSRAPDLSSDVPQNPQDDTNDVHDVSSSYILSVDALMDLGDNCDEHSSDFRHSK